LGLEKQNPAQEEQDQDSAACSLVVSFFQSY